MSIKKHLEHEFSIIELPNWTKEALLICAEIFSEQGHSGGSAGVVIGSLAQWGKLNYPNPTDKASLLFRIKSTLIGATQGDRVILETLTNFLVRALSYEPLTPLSGEENEWIDNQNRRMGSVFRDPETGKAYWAEGLRFNEPAVSLSIWLGYVGYYSRTEIEFPWSPTEPKYAYYMDRERDVPLPDIFNPDDFLKTRFLSGGAGYSQDLLIEPSAFFVEPEDVTPLLEVLDKLLCPHRGKIVGGEIKLDLVTKLESVLWQDEGADPNLEVTLRDTEISFPQRYAAPLKRLVATLPYQCKVGEDGTLTGLRDTLVVLKTAALFVPNKNFQDWTPLTGEHAKKVGFVWRLKRPDSKAITSDEEPKFCLEKLGYEFRYLGIDDDRFLWSQRRRFKLKHPKEKDRKRCDGAVDGSYPVAPND